MCMLKLLPWTSVILLYENISILLWDFDVGKPGILVIHTACSDGPVGLLLFLQSASFDVLVSASAGSFFVAGFLMAKDLVSG